MPTSTKTLTQFEVLAQPVAPGVPNVPFVQQGFFAQISNPGATPVAVTLGYASSTPPFVATVGAVVLFVNYIDQTGTANQYNGFLAGATPGFTNITIPANSTFIFGVQYLLASPSVFPKFSPGTGSTPQDSVAARGLFSVTAPVGDTLYILATVRQVFYNYGPLGALLDYAEGAYSVPLVNGPMQTF